MGYFNTDDQLCFHRKTIVAGNAAMGVWVRCGSWASGQKTDGLIPFEIARSVGKPAEVAALIKAGFWEETSTGYQMHDYPDHNMLAAEQEALSAKRAEAGRKGGSSKRPGLRAIRS